MATKVGIEKLQNTQMHERIISLNALMQHTGVLGYAVARNMRILQEECTEYLAVYQQAITKYGFEVEEHSTVDSKYFTISPETPTFKDFLSMVKPLSTIEHTVPIMKVSYDEVYDQLTAEQLMKFEWMLFDSGSNTPSELE